MNRCDVVCSWSLRPNDPEHLVGLVRETGCSGVQLALEPIRARGWSIDHTLDTLGGSGIDLVSGMIEAVDEDYSTIESICETGGLRPDSTWSENLDRAGECAQIAESLKIPLVSMHAGRVPAEESGQSFETLVNRVRAVTDVFAVAGVKVALETGAEPARSLRRLIDAADRPGLRVSFDPANFLLFGTDDPLSAFDVLADQIAHVHVKDATAPDSAGEWGSEVELGAGGVPWVRLLERIGRETPDVPLVIERESGERRVDDVRSARLQLARDTGAAR